MISIKLHPQLHEAVHQRNRSHDQAPTHAVPAAAGLSLDESTALIRTFSHSSMNRKQALTERNSDWG
ncbi:hypothetical protein WMW72_02835 [Paenibacillus filicis]|uniref:Uncharacterized protein n=1 Tax=Paenibacillus filicis TaxID=669464 RepID=A0ABU9DDB8_9BACL